MSWFAMAASAAFSMLRRCGLNVFEAERGLPLRSDRRDKDRR
jgi:hypothetical protein